MLQRNVKLRAFLKKVGDSELDTFLLSPPEDRKVSNVLNFLKDMQRVQLVLERNDLTLPNVRDDFSEAIEAFPSMQNRLKSDAPIVHNLLFEDTIVQIQSDKEGKEACKID